MLIYKTKMTAWDAHKSDDFIKAFKVTFAYKLSTEQLEQQLDNRKKKTDESWDAYYIDIMRTREQVLETIKEAKKIIYLLYI